MINLIKQEKQTPANTIGKDSTVSQCLDVSSTADEEYFKTVSWIHLTSFLMQYIELFLNFLFKIIFPVSVTFLLP